MKRIAAFAAVLLGAAVLAAPVHADNYPSRRVTIFVPYPAGGPTDQVARIVADRLSKTFKQTFIVEDLPGGGTILATNKVAHAAPDGYTLLLHNIQISANVSLYKKLSFDTEKDLTPVMIINHNALVIAGRKDLPPDNLKQLLAYMNTHDTTFAIPGYGTAGHLVASLFVREVKHPVTLVPYRGGAPALVDTLGGHVDLFIGTPQAVVAHAKRGELKIYGYTGTEKSAQFPKAANLVKALGPKYDIGFWEGLFAPAGTSKAIVARLNAAMEDMLHDPAVLKIWARQGVTPMPKSMRSPAAGRKYVKQQIAFWAKVIHDNNIHLQP
ncbi:MAG TPA: tripartite tricarboxylate transporter substrate-binding protein [Pseudolabrys sp.]|nr:tripartite tricarboxylate transporter substrate-binding protein [Pseudolabrys sp.]